MGDLDAIYLSDHTTMSSIRKGGITMAKAAKKASRRLYTPADLEEAVNVLLKTLAAGKPRENGRVIRVKAAAAMLHSLGAKSRGVVIEGCCTQGCCDALALRIIRGGR
jgi:hypothetical protein